MMRTVPQLNSNFLADRTHVSLQQQNTITPVKCHNPYAASVIPSNPDEVMFHRSLTHEPYTPTVRPSAYEPMYGGASEGFSPLQRVPQVEFPPATPTHYNFGFSSSPYQDAAEALSNSTLRTTLTKVYVGGRPVAVASAAQPSMPAPVLAAPPAMAVPTNHRQAPVVEEPALGKDVVVMVAFRRSEAQFIIRDARQVFGGPRSQSQIIGRHVIVEGDRGEDLGRIVSVVERQKKEEPTNMSAVKRPAARDEATRYETTLRTEELKALEHAQQQASRFFTSDVLMVKDATFQFDKQKLTLWYQSSERVYFVPLLKSMNSTYHCRIWMERADDSESDNDSNDK